MNELITFSLFVFVSSVIINGWHEITRTGRVFGFWQSFWQHYTLDDETQPPVYRFPHWVRFPISECVMCMSSVYGTTIFLITVFIFKNSLLLSYSIVQIGLIWVAYVLCLTCSNYYVHLKIK